MKKLSAVLLKTVTFLVGWVLLASVIPIPEFSYPAMWRFAAECIPLLSIVVMTMIFIRIDKADGVRYFFYSSPKIVIYSGILGLLWLGVPTGVLMLLGNIRFEGYQRVGFLWLWMISAFLNTIMQELLVRGYLYQMIKKNYNTIAAAVATTILFTLAHGGAFEAGLIPVCNVVTMSLFMTVLLEYTDSLISPMIVHFLWNGIGAIILGGVSLADDYPHVWNMVLSGNKLLSGGSYKIEGSVLVLFMNVMLFLTVWWKMGKNNKEWMKKE